MSALYKDLKYTSGKIFRTGRLGKRVNCIGNFSVHVLSESLFEVAISYERS